MMMLMNRTIARDSLIGMALADDLEACHAAATDGEGRTDWEELDHQYEQHDFLADRLEEAADVLSVFAEEATRFAA